MENWEIFEIESVEYLNETFNEYAEFTRQGGSDSTVPDILAETKDNKQFYIEAKMRSSQCGQFVLLPRDESKTFQYSSKSEENEYSKEIKSYMEDNYDTYSTAGGRGRIIELDKNIFYNWVKNYYHSKNVKFFISNNGEHFTIIPLEEINNYFDISSKYRMKRSGTSHPSRNNKSEIISILEELKKTHEKDYTLEYGNSKNKTYVTMDLDLKDKYISGSEYEYLFRKENNRFYIKRRAKTCNSNVIFSIRLKRKKLPKEELFKAYLEAQNKKESE